MVLAAGIYRLRRPVQPRLKPPAKTAFVRSIGVHEILLDADAFRIMLADYER